MAFNLVSVIFVIAVRPFELRLLHYLNVFNEVIGLLVSYILLTLQDMSYDPEQ